MAHVNHFLAEIDRVERRAFKESIIATRVAGATDESYKRYMQHLIAAERAAEQSRTGYRGRRGPMTPEELAAIESQQHVHFNDLPEHEKVKLNKEIESLWAQIPAHILPKSKKLAGQ